MQNTLQTMFQRPARNFGPKGDMGAVSLRRGVPVGATLRAARQVTGVLTLLCQRDVDMDRVQIDGRREKMTHTAHEVCDCFDSWGPLERDLSPM